MVFRYYIFRFVIYLLLVVPLLLSFPCLLSSIFIILGACLYFFAGIVMKEQWNPGWPDQKKKVLKEMAAPTVPPPRASTVIANPRANP